MNPLWKDYVNTVAGYTVSDAEALAFVEEMELNERTLLSEIQSQSRREKSFRRFERIDRKVPDPVRSVSVRSRSAA